MTITNTYGVVSRERREKKKEGLRKEVGKRKGHCNLKNRGEEKRSWNEVLRKGRGE